ncbi:uncharacterized protein LOC116297189 [Actinia tenebrosa]|uniref:Uncharacterized protein LOC116297189 n=1 Tax=Actinia tenebrosa TaxID=6105 RepID=A0A1D8RAC5_ACTTE|nr:uncharacterized protein LOC116297189 [Actinia tenebrosa]AOW69249.1 hypothetical protein [Actinia tenebrosa]
MGSGSSKKKSKATISTVKAAQAFKHPDKTSGKKKGKANVLISFHSKNYQKAQEAGSIIRDNGYNVFLISEGSPFALGLREQSVQWCDVFVIIATFNYQRSHYCVELANYAKDKKKPVVSLLAQPNYSPSGSVGAISLAWGKPIHHVQNSQESNDQLLVALTEKLTGVERSTVSMPTLDTVEGSGLKTEKTQGSYVCIVYLEEGVEVAKMVKSGHGVSNMGAAANTLNQVPIKMGDPKGSNIELIKGCKVFIPILTSGYQDSSKCREEYECARKHEKQIIPVKGEKFWPSGWLSLGIAGKLYYELTDSNQAYTPHKNVPDSTPMNDFIFAVLTAYEGELSEEEREKADIAALTKKIEEVKGKLDEWPPKPRNQEEQRSTPPPPEKLVTQDTENLPFNYIKYEVTRMSFNPPKPLFDKHGIPIEQKFDIMLSYQWDIQDFVRNVYMEMDMKTFKTWMDIWGGMQGNINEAMATAVENSTLMISFLTEKYQKSVNCNLELMYAKQKQMPIIFINVEPNLQLKDWIQELVDKTVVFNMSSISDFGEMDKGVPKINRLAEAARNLMKWSAAQPKKIRTDVSEEVYRLQNLLEDALIALAEKEKRKRYETCTRCGAQFENESSAGCKVHGAYYMGGTILAGRWVCCSQREKDGMGCEKANHITISRKWTEMSHKGCFQWNPK